MPHDHAGPCRFCAAEQILFAVFWSSLALCALGLLAGLWVWGLASVVPAAPTGVGFIP